MGLSTVGFGLFCHVLWDTSFRHPHDIVVAILPVFALALAMYLLALAAAFWAAFGVEELSSEAGSLRWSRKVLKWTRVKDIPITESTDVKATTPWYGIDNTVQVNTTRKQQRIGERLLRDEALELAHLLRQAVGLGR